MKKIYHLIVLLSLISLSSCQKFLDTKPTDFLSPSNYYTTLDQLNFSRAAVYNVLQTPLTWYENYLTFAQADEAFMNRTTMTSGPWNYFYNSADGYVLNIWTSLYDGINKANVLLANIDKNTAIPKASRDAIRGEMLFLRGYYYFQLASFWGGVPLKLEPTTSIIDVDIPKASLKDTYAQILKDMEAAEPLVPDITTLKYSGAISKSAVRGILARVNLYMGGAPLNDKTRYTEASKWAQMVMTDPIAQHSLNASYPQIFVNLAKDVYDIKESIWEVEYWGNNTTQWTEAGNNGYINGPSSNSTWGTDAAYLTITSKFYDVFEPGDNRKWWDIAAFTYGSKPTKTMVTHPVAQATKNTLYPGKWRREYEAVTPQAASSTPINNPLLRYSDILLMYAEAENEINNGPTTAAIKAVNDVRERGWSKGVRTITVTNGGSGYTSAPTVTFSAGSGVSTTLVPATATATATISGGKVTAINLSRDLTGVNYSVEGQYTTPPTITITGGAGTGATATCTIWTKADADLTAAQTASHDAFLSVIQDERMRELNMENFRKFDLLRWGIFLQVNQDMGNKLAFEGASAAIVKYYSIVSSRDLFWPIPSVECVNNKAIVQNPLW
jgi:starch-binding outer membrane protein, SusD/RagB family